MCLAQDAPVLHASVAHARNRSTFPTIMESGIDDLTDEQIVAAEFQCLDYTALDERDRLLEDGNSSLAGANRPAVEGVTLLDGGFGELDKDPGVVLVPEVHGEGTAFADEPICHRGSIDRRSNQDRAHRNLRHPALRHAVPFVTRSGTDEAQRVGYLPHDLVDRLHIRCIQCLSSRVEQRTGAGINW